MKEIVKLYKKSIENNLEEIRGILNEKGVNNEGIEDSCRQILLSSCENISNKWLTGKKYVRTSFVKEAFAEYYPENRVEISIYIDAIINILDDLLDEPTENNNKNLYILEFLRVFSAYNYEAPTKEFQLCMGNYFNKLISLAMMEVKYKTIIDKEKNINTILDHSIKVLNCRSMDIDVFNELVIIDNNYYNDDEIEKIKKMGRIFRAVNIMKKDISDIEHDKETNQESLVTKIAERKDIDLKEYALGLVNYYIGEAEELKSEVSTNIRFTVPINNFCEMTKHENDEIVNLVDKLY